MVGINEGVAQVIVLIGELDGGLLKDDAFLHPVVLAKWPAEMLRTMTSRGTMVTFFTTVSRSLSSWTKWVGTPGAPASA